MKQVAIVQSNYIPWKGYFDLINSVDEFILYDDAQYTKRDWRNRNIIKTANGLKWLTIPVEVKGHFTQKIKDVKIANSKWAHVHFNSLVASYSRASHFKTYIEQFRELYSSDRFRYLSEVNYAFLVEINKVFGIKTQLTRSMDYHFEGDEPSEKLLSLCQRAGANGYLSGPLARDYLKIDLFKSHDIDVSFFDYDQYPQYHQLHPPFEHKVTVLDLIFNEGANASLYMKSFGMDLKNAVGE